MAQSVVVATVPTKGNKEREKPDKEREKPDKEREKPDKEPVSKG